MMISLRRLSLSTISLTKRISKGRFPSKNYIISLLPASSKSYSRASIPSSNPPPPPPPPPPHNEVKNNVISSPFPDIPSPPYPPISEFVTQDWGKKWKLDKIACIDGTTGQTRTFGNFQNDMINIASSLKYDMDINEQSTVALFAPNRVDYTPIVLGVGMTGAKIVPLNPMYTEGELVQVFQQSQPSVLIADVSTIDVALKAGRKCKSVNHIVTIPAPDQEGPGGNVPGGTISLSELKNQKGVSSYSLLEGTVDHVHDNTASHTFILPFSSGTTGTPKGVCLSHSNLVANLHQFDKSERSLFPAEQKAISPLPLFHIYGFTIGSLYMAWRGHEVITNSGRFDLEQFCSLIQEHKPERAYLVPPIMLGLAKHPIVDKYDLSSLKMIISAAAPLGLDIEYTVRRRLGCNVKQGWGMSELSPVGTMNSDSDARQGSIGPPVASTFCKILDMESGQTLGPGESGELLIKGPQVMMEYMNEHEKTAECLSDDGWLRTGDIAYYDEDGYFYITDRLKELIKVRGYPVAPAEIEHLLLTHEGIKDACVVPVKDEMSGELPRAYVVLKEPGSFTNDEIKEWVKERVSPVKRLDGGVVFIDEIPKSASGKLLRRVLREEEG